MQEKITDPDEFEPTSAEIVAGNQDLTAEIFILLPATSLARCIWVSKLWKSFIFNPTFVERHTLIHPPSLSGLFLVPRQTIQSPNVQFISLLKRDEQHFPTPVTSLNLGTLQIIQSCNGLMICQSNQTNYYVCNPTTRQLRTLPRCSYMEDQFGLSLAFDPLASPHYNVVCVQTLHANQTTLHRIATYSSQNRVWSLSEQPVSAPGDSDTDFSDAVYCNGVLHWLKTTETGLYLDLQTKLLNEMPILPRTIEELSQYKFKHFGKSKGFLFFVISRPLLHFYEVYRMKVDYSGWDFCYRVNLNGLVTKYPVMARHFGFHPLFTEYECDVLCINHVKSCDDGDMEIVLSISGAVVVFNLKNKVSVKMHDPIFRSSDVAIWYKVHNVFEYFETLSLV